MPPRRPTAFEVSFPEETVVRPGSSTPAAGGNKRPSSIDGPVGSLRDEKRPRRDQEAQAPKHYTPTDDHILETADLILEGEDFEDEDGADPKPVRLLLNFVIFDSKHDGVVCAPDLMSTDAHAAGSVDRKLEAAGLVSAAHVNEQDEDEINVQEVRLHLRRILHYFFDYTKSSDPFYIQTPHAWYILDSPSNVYRSTWNAFIRPHRIAQFVISSALDEPRQDPTRFREYFCGSWDDILEKLYTEQDLKSKTTVSAIRYAISRTKDSKRLLGTTVICWLLGEHAPSVTYQLVESEPRLSGNLDLAVLQPRNQNPTHVTPHIAALASGLFRERLVVLGPPPAPKDHAALRRQNALENQARERLMGLLSRVGKHRKIVRLKNRRGKSIRLDEPVLSVDNDPYSIGDVLIVPIDEEGNKPSPTFPTCPDEVPLNAKISDYFWFAVLVHVHEDRDLMHVRWFHHSSKTIMREISDSQELFLTDLCNDIHLQAISGKAAVCYARGEQRPEVGFHEYFYKFMYRAAEGCFRSIKPEELPIVPGSKNLLKDCIGCDTEQGETDHIVMTALKHGVHYMDTDFHINDFVLLHNVDDGPAHIGQLMKRVIPSDGDLRRGKEPQLQVRMLGRIGDIVGKAPPELKLIKDERHLFLTDKQDYFKLSYLIGKCFVEQKHCIHDLSQWLASSMNHFYVQYAAPSLTVKSWLNEIYELQPRELRVCSACYDAEMDMVDDIGKFLGEMKQQPLRALDPFAGVGTFGMGLEESGCVRMTHAVEISPSAAKTLKCNSPATTVYNQCSNKILQWAIKRHAGHEVTSPTSVGDSGYLPSPPEPGDIDMITAGFPCQPHSHLNMFQKADDRKSNLILNLLSWVDFLKPKFCYFENVRGFLDFRLMSYQHSRYTVRGGVEMGGLKFLVHALISMNYQLRFALLQAGHYGSPQVRVRFFLIAARHDQPLPLFPQPTHDFTVADNIDIKMPDGESFHQIRMTRGTAPHQGVTVRDAISDLLRFDWKHPRLSHEPEDVRHKLIERADVVPQVDVNLLSPHAGLELRGFNVRYESNAETSYQVWCRVGGQRGQRIGVKDLQHFTRVLKPVIVERVVKIPLKPKADYRSLPSNLQEWLSDNPYSATARKGFRPGLYGRIDGNGYFSTTVTNVEPTAKQSWVLHPYCKRTVTVRELARSQGFPDWFLFYAMDDSVRTMHRQIGNAVPWPVSMALGRELRNALFRQWKESPDGAHVDDRE